MREYNHHTLCSLCRLYTLLVHAECSIITGSVHVNEWRMDMFAIETYLAVDLFYCIFMLHKDLNLITKTDGENHTQILS